MEPTSATDPPTRSSGQTRAIVVGLVLAAGGLVASQVTSIPAILLDPTILQSPADASRFAVAAMMALSFTGFALVGIAYLLATDRGLAFIDLRWPTLRELGYAVGGAVLAYVLVIVVSVLATVLDLATTEAQAAEIVGQDPTMVLIMLAIVFLFNAPAEEFLFRNVIQKRLYDAFSRMGAIVVTSVIFVVAHIPTYAVTIDGSVAPAGAILVPSLVLFAGSVIFGYLYAETENLVVPTIAHALFNGIQFGLLYLVLRYGSPDDVDAVTGVAVDLVALLA